MRKTTIKLSSAARETMSAHLRSSYPHEGCGVLIGNSDAARVRIECAAGLPNRMAPSTNDRFEIDPLRYAAIEAELRGGAQRIVGFFHSHPDGRPEPSHIDLEMAQGLFDAACEFYIYAIQAITAESAGEIRFWRLNPDRTAFECIELRSDSVSRASRPPGRTTKHR